MVQQSGSHFSSAIALAQRFEGQHGDYIIVDDRFSKGAEISRYYFDGKYGFWFKASSMDMPDECQYRVSRTISRAGAVQEQHIEDDDLERVEQNLADYLFHQDAFVWRGPVVAALWPISVLFAWRLR